MVYDVLSYEHVDMHEFRLLNYANVLEIGFRRDRELIIHP